MGSPAERYQPEQPNPELSIVDGVKKSILLNPALPKNDGARAVASAEIATKVKESFQALFGVGERAKIENLEYELRYEAVKIVLQDLEMLPADENLDEEEAKQFFNAYASAYNDQAELSVAERGDLYDAYNDHPAILAIDTAWKTGLSQSNAAPMQRTMFLLLERYSPSSES